MPEVSQHDFSGGLNASAPVHLVGENEVAAAENIDFSLERGAAECRRGAADLHSIGAAGLVDGLYRHYSDPFNIGASPWYVSIGATVFRGVNGTFAAILTGGGSYTTFGFYKDHALICNGTGLVKDAKGTAVYEAVDWVKQAPANAPTVTVSTLTALTVADVFSVSEGTLSGNGTSTATVTCNDITFRAQIDATPLATNLNLNGTNTIGDYGVDYLHIRFSEPKLVVRVSRDYSIGDTNFTNYWHTEMDVELADEALPEQDNLIEAAKNATLEEIEQMISDARQNIRAPRTRVSAAKDTFNVWAVPRTKFELISQDAQNVGWDNIQAVRIVVEALGPVEVQVRDWTIRGAESYPLNDPEVGITYWETWATIEDGAVVSESAEGPASAPLKCQGARAVIVSSATPTGTHGLTHRLWYRAGGLLRAPYCVGTTGLATATFTDSMTDIEALRRRVMLERNLLSRAAMWGDLSAISEPWHDRIFVMYENRIRWSLPGRPDCFPVDSETTVSHAGDIGKALIVWPPGLIVMNRDSVYEMHGSIFEGSGQDWVLQRTGSRHGVRAVRTAIKTPYGIPLLDYDGLYMYIPGQGVDVCVDWVMERLGDAWRGAGSGNPAALKGNRIPAINLSYLQDSCAAYQDGKLYLGVPTGTNTVPNTLFVLDFRTKQCQVYTYPFSFKTLFWDFEGNRLMAGGDGKLIWLEQATADPGNASIAWSVRTRAWTTTADTVLENFSIEHRVNGGQVEAIFDNTSTVTLGTLTNTVRDWSTFKMSGTYANNVWFRILGTQPAGNQHALYGFKWTALVEPPRVQFWRTEHDIAGHKGGKRWDTHIGDLEILGTGTVLGKIFVDGTAVMTATYTGPTAGRLRKKTAFPIDIFGDISYTIYESSGSVWFKHWESTYEVRPEPNQVNIWKTDPESLEENICDAVDFDINPNGTVTSTVFVDNVAKGTFTSVGTAQQSFTHALPNETYGRTIYTVHQGTAFKHYKTWYHLRQEPDRWTNFVTPRISGPERWWKKYLGVVDCLGSTVLATVMVDEAAVGTYTLTGSGRLSYPFALPSETYGKSIYTIYNGSGKFKHYATDYDSEPEPDRVTFAETQIETAPSVGVVKTWLPTINPLGQVVTGTALLDGVAVATETFTGYLRKTWEVGLPNITTGKTLKAVYSATGPFKHYRTTWEVEPKPFGKKTWVVTYKRVGGATQLDLARFFDLEIEPQGTATVTSVWDVDGTAVQTNTLVYTAREWKDRIPFGPGARGYLFQQRLSATVPFHVWRSNLDIQRVGIKGLSRVTIRGTPED